MKKKRKRQLEDNNALLGFELDEAKVSPAASMSFL